MRRDVVLPELDAASGGGCGVLSAALALQQKCGSCRNVTQGPQEFMNHGVLHVSGFGHFDIFHVHLPVGATEMK